MRVLLNAESFGFGPSAAISAIFSFIEVLPQVTCIDYIGNGHSIELQKSLPYETIHVLTHDFEKEFKDIVKHYDVFITALDFEKAAWAKQCHVKTIIYDTLLWYWRKIPPILQQCDLYMTQNFFGVEERLMDLHCNKYALVAPLLKKVNIEDITNKTTDKSLVLINFGGLENPHWSIDITVNYIKNILHVLLPLLEKEDVKVICSKNHAHYLKQYNVMTSSYHQTQALLSCTKLLIATPGLGNIYEAGNYQMKTLFLPPANDSQGQQLKILQNRGLISCSIDWADLECSVNYENAQLVVLQDIAQNIANINSAVLKEKFKARLTQVFNTNTITHDLSQVIKHFAICSELKDVLQQELMEMERNYD